MHNIDLSLLVAYRNRPEHLESLINWFPEARKRTQANLELVIVESNDKPTIHEEQLPPGVIYHFAEHSGPFNKSRILNACLQRASGKLVTAFDVDLIPFNLSFNLHLELASQSSRTLIAGYRVCSPWRNFRVSQLVELQNSVAIARENTHEGFLADQLLHGHRFGICPFFTRTVLNDLDGWDERYVGWGGEDQDIIHRYLNTGKYLLTSHDLVYIHLAHDHVSDWNDGELTRKNRAYFYDKLKLKPNIL